MNEHQRLIDLLDRLVRVAGNERNAHGLKPVQWEALRYFSRANRFSRTPSGLQQFLGVTKGTVSQTIIALEKKGLLEKSPDPLDRRAVAVSLTPAGRQRLSQDPLQRLCQDLAELPADAQRCLEDSLEKLLLVALHRRDRQAFGFCRDCIHFSGQHEQGDPHFCTLLQVPLAQQDATLICREQRPA